MTRAKQKPKAAEPGEGQQAAPQHRANDTYGVLPVETARACCDDGAPAEVDEQAEAEHREGPAQQGGDPRRSAGLVSSGVGQASHSGMSGILHPNVVRFCGGACRGPRVPS